MLCKWKIDGAELTGEWFTFPKTFTRFVKGSFKKGNNGPEVKWGEYDQVTGELQGVFIANISKDWKTKTGKGWLG